MLFHLYVIYFYFYVRIYKIMVSKPFHNTHYRVVTNVFAAAAAVSVVADVVVVVVVVVVVAAAAAVILVAGVVVVAVLVLFCRFSCC